MVSSVCHDQVVQSLKPFTIWEVIVNKNLCCDAWGINILKKDQVWETTYLVVDRNLTGTNLLKHMLPSLAFPFCKKNNLPKLYFDACRAVSQKTEKPRWKKCSRKKREKIVRGNGWLPWARSSYGWRSATEELNMGNETFWLWVQSGKRSSTCCCYCFCCCYYCWNPIDDYFRPFLVTHNLANDQLQIVLEVRKTSYTLHSIS